MPTSEYTLVHSDLANQSNKSEQRFVGVPPNWWFIYRFLKAF